MQYRWNKTKCKTRNSTIDEDVTRLESNDRFRVSAEVFEFVGYSQASEFDLPLIAYYGDEKKYDLNGTFSKRLQSSFNTSEAVDCWALSPSINTTEIGEISLKSVNRPGFGFDVWIPLIIAAGLSSYLIIGFMTRTLERFSLVAEHRRETLRRVAALTQPANAAGSQGRVVCLTGAQARFVCNVFGHEWYPLLDQQSGRPKEEDRPPDSTTGDAVEATNSVAEPSAPSVEAVGASSSSKRNMKKNSVPADDWICAICLDDSDRLTRSVVRTVVFPCSHRFHRSCIRHWLRKGKPSCPLCLWDVRVMFDSSGAPTRNVVEMEDRSTEVVCDAIVSNEEEEPSEPLHLDASDIERFNQGLETWQFLRNEDSLSSTRLVASSTGLPEESIP